MRPEKRENMASRERRLEDIVSVGPAMKRDLALLGVHSVIALARCEAEDLYRRLCRKTGKRQDPCVLDIYCAAVEQARDPLLPPEQCVWWYWSSRRKESAEAGSRVTKSKVNRKEK
jgi:hypothetical protein